jgi:transcriptional regulator with XRE-family HTH domain
VGNTNDAAADRRKALGRAIRRHRGDGPQTAMAKALGVSQGSVSAWENGTTEPPLSRIFDIETHFGLPRGTLLTEAGYIAQTASSQPAIPAALARLDAAIGALLEALQGADRPR